MNTISIRVPAVRIALSILVVIAFGLAIYRFYGGLGSATNLTDAMPWGLWIGFDMLCGIALVVGVWRLGVPGHMFGM